MPWRLIAILAVFAVLLIFVTFNLENKCDISFGFVVINQAPVFLTVFVSFALGLFCAFPLLLRSKKTNNDKPVSEKKQSSKSNFFKRKEKNTDSGSYEIK